MEEQRIAVPLVASIIMVDCVDSGQRERILRLALDGLRYQPSDA
jgi:hypothetical protein